MMARPRATSSRTNSGVTNSGTDAPKLSPSSCAFLGDVEHFLAAEIFALGDVDHFLGDDAGAGPFELGDGVVLFPSSPVGRSSEVGVGRFIAIADGR